jgi:hypothetical protein
VQCNRIVGIVIGLALARDNDGRAKFVRTGTFRLGDPLDRYGATDMVKVVDRPWSNCSRLGWWAEEDHERHADQVRLAIWLQSVQGRRWLDNPARDAIAHVGGAPDTSRDPASDENKKLC